MARSRSLSVAGAAISTSTSDPPASYCASDTRPPCARYLRRQAPPTPTRITAGWPTWNTATTRWRCLSPSWLESSLTGRSVGSREPTLRETDRVKQLGFYVDLDDQMRVRSTPSQVTSELEGSSQFRSRRARDAALDLAHLDGVAKMRLHSVSSCNPTSASCGGNNRCTGSRVQGAVGPIASASGPHPSWSVQRMAPMRQFQMGATGPPPWRLANFGFFTLCQYCRLRGVGFDGELIDRGNSTHETPVYLNVTLREVNADGKESKGPRTGSGVYCCGRRVGRSDSDLLYGFRAGNGSPTPRDYDGYSRVG